MPMVVLDTSLDAAAVLQAAVRLDEDGLSVRRLVPTAEIPPWFGPRTVLICGRPTQSLVQSKHPTFAGVQIIVDEFPADEHGIVQLLATINDSMPQPHKQTPG